MSRYVADSVSPLSMCQAVLSVKVCPNVRFLLFGTVGITARLPAGILEDDTTSSRIGQ